MDASLYGMTPMMTAVNHDRDLREYARWEYVRADTAWLVSTAVRPRGPGLGKRVRLRVRAWFDLVRRPAPSSAVGTED